MGRRARTFAAVAAGLALGAIALACGIDAVATRDLPGPPDASETGEVIRPPNPEGGIPDADADADAGVDASVSCAAGHGPMVIVDAGGLFFCIDATEVRNDAYDKFLLATGNGNVEAGVFDGGAPEGCAANTTYLRQGVAGASDLPVVDIDWCDANGYCRWAGKRLCGKIVNGDTSTGEWFVACSNGGKQGFPYGAVYDGSACNDTNVGIHAVGTHPGCQGSVPGLFDMNSNVGEFVDNCGDVNCSSMGGDYSGPGSCQGASEYPRGLTFGSIGFRCCGDPR